LFASQDNTDFSFLLGPLGGGRPCFLLPDESVVGDSHDIASIAGKKETGLGSRTLIEDEKEIMMSK
jgi:hypothetical protein